MRPLKRISPLLILALLAGMVAFAQQNNSTTWKKAVSRIISLRDGRNNKSNMVSSLLYKDIVEKATSGDLPVYSGFDNKFTILSKRELSNILYNTSDTPVIEYPSSNYPAPALIAPGFLYDSIYQYKILEHWEFDPIAYKTFVHLQGIAPLRNVYIDDVYRSKVPLFRLKYVDAARILPHDTYTGILIDKIWQDYFLQDTIKENQHLISNTSPISQQAIRLIDMWQEEDTIPHHLRDEYWKDSAMLSILVNAIMENKITAWGDDEHLFSRKLTKADVMKTVAPKMDTVISDDIITGGESTEIIAHDFNYDNVLRYKLLEEWTFDPEKGTTEIQVTGIAPTIDIINDTGKITDTKTLFWMKLSDVKEIIASFEQYHPDNTIASHIWHNYFLSDVKPSKVK